MSRRGTNSCPVATTSSRTESRSEGEGVGDERDRSRGKRTAHIDRGEQHVSQSAATA